MKETKQEIRKQYLYFSESEQELEKAGVGVTMPDHQGGEPVGGELPLPDHQGNQGWDLPLPDHQGDQGWGLPLQDHQGDQGRGLHRASSDHKFTQQTWMFLFFGRKQQQQPVSVLPTCISI